MDLLASVEVAWELRGSEEVDYLVTWTESTGSISGHLVTKQDKAEISLWPQQRYSVQVRSLSLSILERIEANILKIILSINISNN